jgi:hypothetical protein
MALDPASKNSRSGDPTEWNPVAPDTVIPSEPPVLNGTSRRHRRNYLGPDQWRSPVKVTVLDGLEEAMTRWATWFSCSYTPLVLNAVTRDRAANLETLVKLSTATNALSSPNVVSESRSLHHVCRFLFAER